MSYPSLSQSGPRIVIQSSDKKPVKIVEEEDGSSLDEEFGKASEQKESLKIAKSGRQKPKKDSRSPKNEDESFRVSVSYVDSNKKKQDLATQTLSPKVFPTQSIMNRVLQARKINQDKVMMN